jgi:hypothetical protein
MPPDTRSYKRSWKNLLINKRYQLRFTLFMVGLSGLLMIGLGIWVMKEADETTNVSLDSKLGTNCGDIEVVEAPPPPPIPMAVEGKDLPPPSPPPDPTGSDGSAGAAEPPRHHHIAVTIEESDMTMMPATQPAAAPVQKVRADLVDQIAKHWTCRLGVWSEMETIRDRRDLILWVMIGTGVALVLGLAGYGIKMTHKVAGPLFKISLYLGKMRNGRFDKVYNLRKGDQLVEFYDHFKAAHAGVVAMEKADINRIKKVIDTAEAAGLGDDAAVAELREMLARKEKSLE